MDDLEIRVEWRSVPVDLQYARRLTTIATCYILIQGGGADIHLSRVACLYTAALNTEVTSLACLMVYAFPHEKGQGVCTTHSSVL